MTPREIASIWLIGIGALAVIIWDHRSQTAAILGTLASNPGPSALATNAAATPLDGQNPVTTLGTNNPMPIIGDRQGSLSTRGTPLDGNVQSLDAAFGDIFSNFGG